MLILIQASSKRVSEATCVHLVRRESDELTRKAMSSRAAAPVSSSVAAIDSQ
jgi:hypothetical protein